MPTEDTINQIEDIGMRKCLANIGDVNPMDHGGFFVLLNDGEAEVCIVEPWGHLSWNVRYFYIPQCYYTGGVLSDNEHHLDHPAWFAKDLESLCGAIGRMPMDFIADITHDDPVRRAFAYRELVEYHGVENFGGDNWPVGRKGFLGLRSRVNRWQRESAATH